MEVKITKIDNGYLVAKVNDDGTVTNPKAILKANTGKVPTRDIGLAVTQILGAIALKKSPRKKKAATAAA